MTPLLIDEHLSQALTDALNARGITAIRVQDVGLNRTPDPVILDRVAVEGWLFVTLDTNTAVGFAYGRAAAGLLVAPLAVVNDARPFREVVEDLETLSSVETLEVLRDRVVTYLPLTR